MKKVPVAQILHSLGNVHHELQQCLQRNMLGGERHKETDYYYFSGHTVWLAGS